MSECEAWLDYQEEHRRRYGYCDDDRDDWRPSRIYIRKPRIAKNFKTEEICDEHLIKSNNFEEDCLFTHNEIPVRKIMVANIESSTTHKHLKRKFASYGEITDCILKRKSSEKNYAFITFKESESAYRAIHDGYNKNINIDGQYLRVLPAAAWHQPDRTKNINKTSVKLVDLDDENRLSAYNHYLSNDESPISKLNEYCLLHIFGYLPIRDRIRIERVCRYWQIISTESLHMYKKFDSILSYDNWKYIKNAPTLYNLLKKFGTCVTRVNDLDKLKGLGNSSLIAIATLCPNIEEIKLSNFPFLASGIKALAKNCTKIKCITIGKSSHESYKNKYDAELSALFSKNRNLQYLEFNGDIIDGSCLKHLSTKYITQISLKSLCCPLFIRVISKIQNLFTLEICSCFDVDIFLQSYMQPYKDFKLNPENIEKLRISEDRLKFFTRGDIIRATQECKIDNFLKSCNLKNLKHLDLARYSLDYITDEFLLTIAENYHHQLTYLDISGAKGVTNSGLIYIITSLSNLEHFHMTNMPQDVTDEIFLCGMPNLKTLNCSNCLGVGDEGLIKFINNSDKLEELNVIGCKLITNKLIFEAIEYIKHRKNEIVLTIFIRYTNVIVNESDLKEKSPFLQLRVHRETFGASATRQLVRQQQRLPIGVVIGPLGAVGLYT